jgi:TRAP-type C4-dicarboxylate transport system permease small subunit
MGFFLVLIVQGWAMIGSVAGQTSAAAQFSMGIPYAAIPIGAMLLFMNSVALFLELVLALRAGEEAS